MKKGDFKFEKPRVFKCLDCGTMVSVINYSVDDLGACVSCPICNSSFDIDIGEDLKITKQQKLQNLYNMIREFYYEKNGVEATIEFLDYMIQELKKTLND